MPEGHHPTAVSAEPPLASVDPAVLHLRPIARCGLELTEELRPSLTVSVEPMANPYDRP